MTPLDEYLAIDDELRRQEGADSSAGLDDSSEQDAIRDRLDGPWHRMTEAEQQECRRRLSERNAIARGTP